MGLVKVSITLCLSLGIVAAVFVALYAIRWPRVQLGTVIVLVLLLVLREGTLLFSKARALLISSNYKDSLFQAYSDGVGAVLDFCHITGIFAIASWIAIIVLLARGTKGRMDVFSKFTKPGDN